MWLSSQRKGAPGDAPLRLTLQVVDHPVFNGSVMLLIVANTILLSLEYDGQSDEYERALSVGNLICTCLFTLEILLKMFTHDWRELFKVGQALDLHPT